MSHYSHGLDLDLLQEIRDESHRFAINAQRKKKNAKNRRSQLDKIEGIEQGIDNSKFFIWQKKKSSNSGATNKKLQLKEDCSI